ncbi:MAG: hypothetical protein HZY76_11455 [Anaerolineae bacterium]|nr:MAG: hypothetical protein HZY76_11455 [Anaerolineae bacterium]
MNTSSSHLTLAAGAWCWHDAYYAGRWSLLDQPAGRAAGLTAIECNDFMLPPPRLSRLRQPLLGLLPGAPPELWRYSRTSLRQLQANAQTQGVQLLTWAINSDFTASGSAWPAQQLYLRRGLARPVNWPPPAARHPGRQPRDAACARVDCPAAGGPGAGQPCPVTLENHWNQHGYRATWRSSTRPPRPCRTGNARAWAAASTLATCPKTGSVRTGGVSWPAAPTTSTSRPSRSTPRGGDAPAPRGGLRTAGRGRLPRPNDHRIRR